LSYQPDILVFDEPSTNMDPLNRRRLIEWLQQSDKTILLCTHDLDIALEVCSRCLMLSEGTFVEDGPAKEILHDRKLLEQHNLELPLALMTHELLNDKLRSGQMDEEHREIIASFLHAHKHSHGPGDHEHVHIHFHGHEHEHLHEDVASDHFHDQAGEHQEHLHESDFLQHTHGEQTHHHHHDHDHSHDDDHTHSHEHAKTEK